MRVDTHLWKHDDICNPSVSKSTAEQDENIEIVVNTVVNSLVNTVVGILDDDGEILDDDDGEEEEQGSKKVNSGIMSIDEREELEKELIRDKKFLTSDERAQGKEQESIIIYDFLRRKSDVINQTKTAKKCTY